MSIRIDGTNTTANPGITGADADTGLQFGTDEIQFVTGGTNRATVESNGNFTIENGNLVLANNSGIDFSATADGSGATNINELLDDYEEGTFTPIIETGGSVHTYAADGQIGNYIKIGNMVYVQFFIQVATTTNTGGASVFRMGQLPFQSQAAARFIVGVNGVNFDASAYKFDGYLASSDQVRIIYEYDNSSNVAALGNTFIFGSGDSVRVAGWYKIE